MCLFSPVLKEVIPLQNDPKFSVLLSILKLFDL